MAKSKIIKEIANKEISLEVAFNRLLIIASDIENQDLINWATNELNGYSNKSLILAYRQSGIGQILYSGINGGYKVKDIPLPYGAIDDDLMEVLRKNSFSHDISSLEKFTNENNSNGVGINITDLAGIVYKNTGIECVNIYMKFTQETFLRILSNIRTKLLTVFLELDKELGCLDELDINTNSKNLQKMNEKLNIIIYEDNSVSIGDNNKLKDNLLKN